MRLVMIAVGMGTLYGCIASTPMHFSGLAKPGAALPNAEVVKEDVYTTVCPRKGESYGSYEEAVRLAIASAPGANALINVEFGSAGRGLNKVCAEVTGDAVRM